MGRGRRTLGTLLALGFAEAGMAAGCVDGTTPSCSDPAVQCGPSVDGSADRAETAPDVRQDTAPDTFVPDAAPDADLDAGDEI
jgi:hypothetical protein